MAKSRNRKDHKEKVEKFKDSQNQKLRQMAEIQQPQIPEVREVPIWSSNQTIEMNGLEFQAIFNYINNVQGAYGAIQSIMNKNIINGNVKLSFEKLNEDKTDYVPMTDDEQKPHIEQFEKMLDAMRNQAQRIAEDAVQLPPVSDSQEGVPFIDGLVDANGNQISSK
jgi:hypothetical protein